MAEHNTFGKNGEHYAEEYLRKKNYIILETNFHWGKNEIDIIALDGQFLVFVEVKTRHSAWAGEPEKAVTKEKQRSIVRAANGYIQKFNRMEESRFDIVSILVDNGAIPKITHIVDAFSPLMNSY